VEAAIHILAALSASLFAGSALYASLVESRTILARSHEDAVTEFVQQLAGPVCFRPLWSWWAR